MMTPQSHFRFWGKTDQQSEDDPPPFHLLPYHNLDVAAAGKCLLEQNRLWRDRLATALGLSEEQLIPFTTLLLALHDVGKFSGSFQYLNKKLCMELGAGVDRQEYHVRHDTLGYLLWRDVLHDLMWQEDWLGIKALDPLADEDPDGGWDYMEPLVQAVTGHHGAPPQPESHHRRQFFDDTAVEAAVNYAQSVRALLLPDAPFDAWNYEEHVPRAQRATWLLAGFAVLADWIGSNAGPSAGYFFRFEHEEVPLVDYWHEAVKQAEDAIRTAGVVAPSSSRAATGLHRLFPQHAEKKHTPSPLQEQATQCPVETGSQLFILEDATGSGKTEGAAILVHRLMQQGEAEGAYFGLPTMATANAMHSRLGTTYRHFFHADGSPSYVLAHSAREHVASFRDTFRLERPDSDPDETQGTAGGGGAEPEPTGQAQCAAWLADNRKKALLAQVGVGTIDQALIGALPSKHQSLRLLGLGRNVLVVDEVHAYDEYVSSLLRHVLRFQAAMGGSAVLLSATLPKVLRQKLCDAFRQGLPDPEDTNTAVACDDFPLLTRVRPNGEVSETPIAASERSRHHVRVTFSESDSPEAAIEEVSGKLLRVARDGGCACWIRNTVDDATDAWRHLREQYDQDKVLLFHARFAFGDRQAIEEKVLHHFGERSGPEERSGYILVATQVVEQSLDLDFDHLVSDLAPIDLLIQRAGRLHRHKRDHRPAFASTPELCVVTPPLSDDPPDTWYADLFPRGRYVYPHAGHLWRTMKVLMEEEHIRIPENARSLLSAVYREDDLEHPATREEDGEWGIPSGLLTASNEAVNEAKQASAEANHNALHLDGGYGSLKAGGRRWFGEKRTPTRLGDPTTTLRVARWEADQLVPWADAGDELDTLIQDLDTVRADAEREGWNEARSERARSLRQEIAGLWQRSELTVRESKIFEEANWRKGREADTVAALEGRMPDGGKWSVLLALEWDADDESWKGRAKKENGQYRHVTYSPEAGLAFTD